VNGEGLAHWGLLREIKKRFGILKNYVNELKPGVYVPLLVVFKKYIFSTLKSSGYVPLGFILK
jgi:hypothetical protein